MAWVFARERLSSSSLTAWPFDQASNVPARVYRLFSDCAATVPASRLSECRLSVSGVSVSGGSLSFSVGMYGDATENVVVFPDGVDGYTVVYAFSGTVSFVVDNAHILDSGDFSDNGAYALSAGVVDPDVPKVESMSIWNSEGGGRFPVRTESGISGDVSILAGSNMSVENTRNGSGSITLSAIPGAGEGVVPCGCHDSNGDDYDRHIVPDEYGEIILSADGCYQVTPYPELGQVSISGRCSACCPVEKCAEVAVEEQAESDEMMKAFFQLMHERYYIRRGVEKLNYGLEWNVSMDRTWPTLGYSRWSPSFERCMEFHDLYNPNLVVKMGVVKSFEKFDFSDTYIKGKFERVAVSGHLINKMRKTEATLSFKGFSVHEIDGTFTRRDSYAMSVVQSFSVRTPSGEVITGSMDSNGVLGLPDFTLPPRSIAEFSAVFMKESPRGSMGAFDAGRTPLSPDEDEVYNPNYSLPAKRGWVDSSLGILAWVDFEASWTNRLTHEDAEDVRSGNRESVEASFRWPITAYVSNFMKVDGGSTDDKEDDRYIIVDDDYDSGGIGELEDVADRAYMSLGVVLKESVSSSGNNRAYSTYRDRLLDPDSLFNGCYRPESLSDFWSMA